ncbi:MAG TPA: hypothetical protein P5560_06025 [Thermotogota bacterium]|nr:hypothetical protein [Thermotogota bacterium]HRW92496.1 hypothetical protein [Thermotogota bacterium]
MLAKMEAFFMKEFVEKAGKLAIFSLLLLIPSFPVRMFFLLLLVSSMLPWDVQHKRMSLLTSIPFSSGELFWVSYLFLLTIALTTQLIGSAIFLWDISLGWVGINLLGTLIFSTAYFGISMLCVIVGLDNFGMPFLIWIGDIIIGGIGSRFSNPWFFLSPSHQGNVLMSGAVAATLLALAFWAFQTKGVKK